MLHKLLSLFISGFPFLLILSVERIKDLVNPLTQSRRLQVKNPSNQVHEPVKLQRLMKRAWRVFWHPITYLGNLFQFCLSMFIHFLRRFLLHQLRKPLSLPDNRFCSYYDRLIESSLLEIVSHAKIEVRVRRCFSQFGLGFFYYSLQTYFEQLVIVGCPDVAAVKPQENTLIGIEPVGKYIFRKQGTLHAMNRFTAPVFMDFV